MLTTRHTLSTITCAVTVASVIFAASSALAHEPVKPGSKPQRHIEFPDSARYRT